jgi:hypothetical protein
VAVARNGSVILHRAWRELYKPLLDNLFRESASKGVSLTPDVALMKTEHVLESVFLSVKEGGNSERKKALPIRPRLYLRFERIAFRREAHHYAVDLFYKTYFSHKHETAHTKLRIVGSDRSRSALRRGTGVMSRPQMIREVLLKLGGPLSPDKIAEAIEKRFKVKLKRRDITSVIYRAMKEGKSFRKAGINAFALVESPVGHAAQIMKRLSPDEPKA